MAIKEIDIVNLEERARTANLALGRVISESSRVPCKDLLTQRPHAVRGVSDVTSAKHLLHSPMETEVNC